MRTKKEYENTSEVFPHFDYVGGGWGWDRYPKLNSYPKTKKVFNRKKRKAKNKIALNSRRKNRN